MDRMEKVQYNFMKLIPDLRDKSYCEQLKLFNLQSLERRFDRYRVIYTRKALLGLVPNLGIKLIHDADHRLGRKVLFPRAGTKLKQESFTVKGPDTFNTLPKDLRNDNGCMDTFKEKLDRFLTLVPDKPRIDADTKFASNTLKNQMKKWTGRFDL